MAFNVTFDANFPLPVHLYPEDVPDALARAKLACAAMRELHPDPPFMEEADTLVAQEAFIQLTAEAPSEIAPATLARFTPAALRHLDAMLSEYDQELVNAAVRIRTYVTNKLLEESANADPKVRLKALELLGRIKEVGLFSDRVEITIQQKGEAEIEMELRARLERFMGLAEEVRKIGTLTPEEVFGTVD